MQLTSKFILFALALAYGGTVVSAISVRESSVVARSAYDSEDLNAPKSMASWNSSSATD